MVRQMTDAERWCALDMLNTAAVECPFGQSADISNGRIRRLSWFSRKREQMAQCPTLELEAVTQLRELIGACSEWCEAISHSLQLCYVGRKKSQM